MNCSNFLHKCKAGCCSHATPLPQSLIVKHADRLQRAAIKVINMGTSPFGEGETAVHETKDGSCVFLKPDYSCAVYEDRPHVCKEFGSEIHPYLCCTIQSKDGRARSRQEQRRVIREQQKYTSKFNAFVKRSVNG